MNAALSLSSRGAALIKAFESCLAPIGNEASRKYRAYRCPAGVPTIGWGHTNAHGRAFTMQTIWSQTECDAAFDEDMDHFVEGVKRLIAVPLNQNQFDALVSFTYNVGESALDHSTLRRKLNASDFEGAAHEFHRWNRAGGQVLRGLVRRRASEALLFQGIADFNYDGKPDVMAQAVDAPLTA